VEVPFVAGQVSAGDRAGTLAPHRRVDVPQHRACFNPRDGEQLAISAGYYAYWSGLPAEGFQGYIRPPRAIGVAPTNDGLTMVTVNWPRTEFDANRRDVEGSVARAFGLVPELAERVRAATRETRIVGTGDLPNFFRKPYGPGWALVGDAGHHKDPITARGDTAAARTVWITVPRRAVVAVQPGPRPGDGSVRRRPGTST
jgi:hypothetical protein